MASDKGSITAEAPPLLPPAVPQQSPSVGNPFLAADDINRAKSLKRARETTPTSPNRTEQQLGDLSPSKIARLVNFARHSPIPPPLTGAAALEDERRRREEEQHQQRLYPPGSSENPSQKVLSELMSGANAAVSRVQDGLMGAGSSAAGSAPATTPLQQPMSLPNHTTAAPAPTPEMSEVGQHNAMSGVITHEQRVVDSPGAMDIDSRNDRPYAPPYAPPQQQQQAQPQQHHMQQQQQPEQQQQPQQQQQQPQQQHQQQPEAQMEDRGTGLAGPVPTSFSYPGMLPPNSTSMPAPPSRGMSLPMAPSPNPERSPSLKKHKCPYCETEFTRHHNLKSHLLTHSQEKPYHCSDCNMRFRRLHDLKRHTKLHTGEKPHICPKCNRKFARADALARHSKGAGGCAGRRSSMGSFGVEEEYDGMGDADDSAMSGVLYNDGTTDGSDMTEEERRRLSLPNKQPGQSSGQGGGHEAYRQPSARTYPPAGPQQTTASGGLFPPNVDRVVPGPGPGPSPSTTSAMPNSSVSGSSHTVNMSISSMPMSAGGSSIFSQSGMTESPKPLSPGPSQLPQPVQDHKPQRSSSLAHQLGATRQEDASHQPPGQAVPPHGTSDAAQSAWLSQYPPPADASDKGPSHTAAGQHAQPQNAAAGQARAPGAAPPGSSDNANNVFTAGEQGLWSYVQILEEKVKTLGEELAAVKRTEAELLQKVGDYDRRNANLTAEVAQLRQEISLAGSGAPAQS